MCNIKPLALVVSVLLPVAVVFGQPCTEEVLLKIPGKWKKGMQGSIENVTAENLAKEKAVLAEIHKMTSGGYQPYGLDAHHSTVFGYNKYTGKQWMADPYEYNVYFLDYLCDHKDNDIKKMWVNAETSTTVYIQANRIFGAEGFSLDPAGFSDDKQEPFSVISAWPQRKDGYWYWPVRDSGFERSTMKKVLYLFTYDGELPFKPFTRKEYLEYQIPRMKKSLVEQTRHAAEIDPNSFDAKSYREIKIAAEERLIEFRKKIEATEQLLVTMSQAELAEGAIVRNDGSTDFQGFFKEGDPFVWILVKPNLEYFRPLPRWVAQFFSVVVSQDTDQEVFRRAISDFEKSLDFGWFRKMLGSTIIVPYGRTSSAVPAVAPAPTAASGIQMPAGTKKNSVPRYDIYQNGPLKDLSQLPRYNL